ncbi:MAG: MlaD family protein [Ignavibacteriaceae bacterium]
MKEQRKTEIKVGVMFIAGVILFIWILGWAKNITFASKEKSINVEFNNVSGLAVGDNVTINGVLKGHVGNISMKDNEVIVNLILDEGVDLRKDAKFAISMTDLMGGKKIDIMPGTSPAPIDYNQMQIGVFYGDVASVISMVGSAQDDLLKTVKNVNVTLTSLNKYLTDQQINKDVKSSLANLSELTKKLNVLVDENLSSIKKITSNSVALTDEAKTFIADNKSDMSQTIKEAANVLRSTDSLVTKINSLTDEIKNKQNNVGKVLYDPKVYQNLTESLQQVNELTKLILKQLKEKGFKVDAKINLF